LSAEQPVRDLIVGIQSDEQSGIQWLLVNAEPIFEDGGAITQVIVTFMDMTERKREENVTEARLRLASAATKRTSETLMQMALDEIEALTDSEVGFYHTLLEDQETLVLQTWSTNTLAHMCDAEGQGSHYPVSEAGIWVECVHERRPVIHNDYAAHPHKKGMPPGHAPIHRELVLPIMRGDQIVAILGVGNKATDYDQKDIEIISLLGDFSWEIIQRKLTEEALQYREEQYSLALRAANAGSWDWNIEADELLWSEQIEPLFGFEEGEFAGTFEAFLDCVHPNDRQSLLDNVEQALNGDKDYAIEHRIIWPDGNVRWVAETGDVLQNEEGDPIRMLGVVQDITSRKQVEQEVVRQKEMLETTLESLTHPFFVLDADDYSIVMANSASLPEEGVSPSATCYAITHKTEKPCANEEHPCPLEEVKRTRAPTKVEHIHYAPDGSPRYVEVYGYPIFDKDGEVTQMIEYTLDITERIAAQKSLAEKTAALVRSNAELEDFAYIASHDLQEPLRKVQAFGDRLKVKYSDVLEGRGLDYLTRMQSAATRMRQLIDDLLTYSRVTTKAKPFETVDLNRVVDEALADLVVRVKETQGKVDVDPLPTIDADRIQMRRMMQNLIGNALKFHKDSEPPMVNIYAEVPRAEETSPLDNATADGFCQIFVEDQGIGFDMAYVEQIFAPFQRLHGRSTYEGTGMGLAICRKIAERHGGEIAAHSKPGEGATFIITLPMKQSKEER
jgi:PAS domain S-box-containing protein